jgi:hypothetical protein
VTPVERPVEGRDQLVEVEADGPALTAGPAEGSELRRTVGLQLLDGGQVLEVHAVTVRS